MSASVLCSVLCFPKTLPTTMATPKHKEASKKSSRVPCAGRAMCDRRYQKMKEDRRTIVALAANRPAGDMLSSVSFGFSSL